MNATITIARMGRKRIPPRGKPKTMRQAFTHRLHDLAGDLTYQQIADGVGVRADTVAKWFSGDNTPDLDYWPKLARTLGVETGDLMPPGF